MNAPVLGQVATGTVVRVYPSYAILLFEGGWTGLLHISELSNNYIRSFESFVTIGSLYSVKVIEVDEKRQNVRVSLKRMQGSDKKKPFRHERIDPSEIDFSALAERLPEWVKEENETDRPLKEETI
jgi:predicted RNA-binding protein with RPS1 domain